MKLCLLLFSALLTSTSFAWREVGHFSVCEIAYRNLTPVAKAKVDKILKGRAFPEQCTWPDMVRKSSQWKHTYDWHFVNVEDHQDYLTPAVVNQKGDVMSAILDSMAKLRAGPSSEKLSSLLFLGHFIGDIHQVVHIGRKSDLGGNKLIVSWFGEEQFDDVEHLRAHDGEHGDCVGPYYQDEPTGECVAVDERKSPINLHKLWDLLMVDTFISENRIRSSGSYPYKEYVAVIDKVSRTQVTHWQNSSVLDWARESLCYRPHLYQVGDAKLGRNYYNVHVKTLNDRMLMAGYRLGHTLNRLFDPAVERKHPEIAKEEAALSSALSELRKGKASPLRLSLKECAVGIYPVPR